MYGISLNAMCEKIVGRVGVLLRGCGGVGEIETD